ncbi:MAG: tRNA pseudouridine(38-40) synthase TruA [Chryseolinea sp.]
MRYFFEIAYYGKNYAGWQNQANAVGIQSVIENALTQIFRQAVKIVGSGRTDTGVHCEQQFFHCDLEKPFDPEQLVIRLNSFLPKDIVVKNIRRVKPEANARFDAIDRTYRYSITRKKNPFLEGLAWHFFRPLNVATMNKAAAYLIGEHDFECFSKVHTDVNHFLCTVKKAHWKEEGEILEFTITANRFLRGMVRSIVGTLIDVGSEKTSMKELQGILQSRDRKNAGQNVPPQGLYLAKIKYPTSIFVKDQEHEDDL